MSGMLFYFRKQAIRIRSWEFWPFWAVQFPLFVYWLWLSLKARSLLFFSASNPHITLGGMFGESKYSVLRQLPDELIPKSILIKSPQSATQVIKLMIESDLQLPLIFKPDIGERGFRVKRINSAEDIEQYLKESHADFIVQELIDWPVECGIFYTRFPEHGHGKVTSIVLKDMLSVTGDGKSTLRKLINDNPRAVLQWERLRNIFRHRLEEVIDDGEKVVLNNIGNHCLGTTFLNGQHLITDNLSLRFDTISKQMGEFYFGRFDLRCRTYQDLADGEIKILEVNGCGAEPAHIYQPGTSLWNAWKVLVFHWKNLYTISRQNHQRGVPYTGLREGLRIFRHYKQQMKT